MTRMQYLIGVDIGTSGVKTVLFDLDGYAIASHTVEYPMHQPQNGWAEQDPEDWWKAVTETLRYVMGKSGANACDVLGIGLSGQMHGLVMLDKEGAVLRKAIIWCDGRTIRECEEITERVGARRLIDISANPALPGFTASKILWVRRNEPELYQNCRRILLPKDYIRYKLTGIFATEVSDASGMNLLDVPKRCWSNEILDALGISPDLLPLVYESCEPTGSLTTEAAWLTGLTAGIPVAGGAGDNAAAAIGMGVVREGRAFTSIGSSGVIFAHSDRVTIDPEGRVHTFCAAAPGKWTVMSCTLSAGLSLKWFRDNFCAAEKETAAGMGVDPYHLMDKQVEQVPVGSNRLIYLPYLMGERSPLLDSGARGLFFGLSAIHTKYDVLRSIMEGVAFSQRQCLDVFHDMGVEPDQMLVCGGGGRSAAWRQMLADIYGCDVYPTSVNEGPALGAAILAGVSAGVYRDVESACDNLIHLEPGLPPDLQAGREYEKYYKIYRELYPALKDQYQALAAL